MDERILVVDDEKDICEILGFNLSNEGYRVDTATSAEEALRKLTPEHALILLDVMMGGLNYQIEHHLFPSMPRPHLRRAAPMIAEYCRSHDVPYTSVSLLTSYAIVVRYINRVGLGERDVFTCPLVEQRSLIGS